MKPGSGAAVALFALLGALSPGCNCGRKPDEELLREKVDTTSVHLYLASKFALLRTDDPGAKPARERFVKALEGAQRAEAPDVSLGDLTTLAMDLWGLRAEGKRILASGQDARPFLPLLLKEPALAQLVDAELEHGLLLAALFLVKFHPQSPAPVPEPIVLYEAWMTHPERLQLEGLGPLLHGIKAIVFGGNELCDLSAKEAKAASVDLPTAEAFGKTSKELFGMVMAAKQLDPAYGAARAVAHGMAGVCYLERPDPEKAAVELDAFCEEAEKLGTPVDELALVRAWVALSRKDKAKAKEHLAVARKSAKTPEEQRALADLEAKLDSDPKALATYLGKGRLALFALELGYRHLAAAGALEPLSKSSLGKTLGGFGRLTGGVMANGKETLPSWQDAKGATERGARSLWDKATR